MPLPRKKAIDACYDETVVHDEDEQGKLLEFLDRLPDDKLAILRRKSSNKAIVSFLRARMAAAHPGAATIEEYHVPALSFSEFEEEGFLARLQSPVLLSPHDAMRCSLERIPKSLGSVVQVGSTTFHDLSQSIMMLRQNKKSGTRTEDGLHARDDALLQLISKVSGMNIERNCRSSSTVEGTRLDAWIGQPPTVMVEEKADATALDQAMAEVHKKFTWILHYEKVDFVFAIAIADDLVKMEAVGRQRSAVSDVFNLHQVEGCIKAVQAAINIGRVCKHILINSLLHPVTIPFNTTISRQRCHIHISHTEVTKTYFKDSMNTTAQARLKDFYNETKDVEFLERATDFKVNKKGELQVKLQPVGLVRRPQSVREAKVAMRCIMTAMAGCSERGWMLNDVRWQNIIKLETGFWCVIDCEFARRVGLPIPSKLAVKCDWAQKCSPSTDLYMVGRLLEELKRELELDKDLDALRQLVTSKQKCYDQGLTASTVMGKFCWLREVSPRGSPGQGVGRKRSAKQTNAEPPAKHQKGKTQKGVTKRK